MLYRSILLIDVGDNPDRPRPGRLWLRNIYHVHQRLSMAFPAPFKKRNDPHFLKPFRPEDFSPNKPESIDPNQVHVRRGPDHGFLFRIDIHPPREIGIYPHRYPPRNPVIIVQSALEPDWDYAFHNAEYLLAAPPEIKPFNPQFENGQRLRFHLLANPTRKIAKVGPDGQKAKQGRRVPVRDDNLNEWLIKRAEENGFSVETQGLIVQTGYVYFSKIYYESKNDKEEHKEHKARLRSARYIGILKVTDADRLRQALISGLGPGKAFGFGLLEVDCSAEGEICLKVKYENSRPTYPS
ncbi:MAG: type I-E CRISPR-associated protein Cas6/Cse3/CasE [bacterium]|nr:type I-E CRISPR-associated protein Cas6/Cse3/CasE [bacterium]